MLYGIFDLLRKPVGSKSRDVRLPRCHQPMCSVVEALGDEDTFNAFGGVGQDLVGYGVDSGGYIMNRHLGSEYDYFIAFVGRYVGYVYHGHVHADIAGYFGALAVDEDFANAPAEGTTESVGIAYGDGGEAHVVFSNSAAAVADGLALRDGFDLRDDGFERCHRFELAEVFGGWIYSVKTYTEADHVELKICEA